MFSESAELYDRIYATFKDYPAEAARLAAWIRAERPGARTILDVACGTGEHARLLQAEHGFEVDGLDLEPKFVEIARAKLPDARVHLADMTDFALPHRYDVVLCLFSSIGYARTLDGARRAIACMRAHLAPGGLLLVEPWFPPGALEVDRVWLRTAETPEGPICRMTHTVVDGRISRITFHYLIGGRDGVEHRREVHELGLFTDEEMRSCFESEGLVVQHDPEGLFGRGLYLARPLAP